MGKLDYDIAKKIKLRPIIEVARELGIQSEDLYAYGPHMAKVLPSFLSRVQSEKKGKLILVSAMTPTPAGEGKSTTTVGLGMGLSRLGKKTMIALREPSLGPCFGVKGGACGGGHSQVLPMEEINLHFTGDFHAITSAHNLLAALIDNHLQQGNSLQIDPRTVAWRRVLDMNDRSLRRIITGLGGKTEGVPRETGFDITVASEVMAILCLCEGLADLRERLGRIIVASTFTGNAVTAADLKAHGAMAALLKQAILPNLVQTSEGTPALVHGGPFANIAHGCSSVIATKLALNMADYCVTEAGFGFDLGGEKFLDIKCRLADLQPSCVVLVATLRALKMHGGVALSALNLADAAAVKKGWANLKRHIDNVKLFGLPVVVALNRFVTDDENEIQALFQLCAEHGITAVLSDVWQKGGLGAEQLAQKVIEKIESNPEKFQHLYASDLSLEDKVRTLVTSFYRGKEVIFHAHALKVFERARSLGLGHLPVCMAKTQYSFSDQPHLLNAPDGFTVEVREAKINAGAGFIVVMTGQIMTMPGLPAIPSAEVIDVDADGAVLGLF